MDFVLSMCCGHLGSQQQSLETICPICFICTYEVGDWRARSAYPADDDAVVPLDAYKLHACLWLFMEVKSESSSSLLPEMA